MAISNDSLMIFMVGMVAGYLVSERLTVLSARRQQTKSLDEKRKRQLRDTQGNIARRITKATVSNLGHMYLIRLHEDMYIDNKYIPHRIIVTQNKWPILMITVDMSSISGGDIRWYGPGAYGSIPSIRFVGAEDSAQDVISFTSMYLGRRLDSKS